MNIDEECLKTNSSGNCICRLPNNHKGSCVCSVCNQKFYGEPSNETMKRMRELR